MFLEEDKRRLGSFFLLLPTTTVLITMTNSNRFTHVYYNENVLGCSRINCTNKINSNFIEEGGRASPTRPGQVSGSHWENHWEAGEAARECFEDVPQKKTPLKPFVNCVMTSRNQALNDASS